MTERSLSYERDTNNSCVSGTGRYLVASSSTVGNTALSAPPNSGVVVVIGFILGFFKKNLVCFAFGGDLGLIWLGCDELADEWLVGLVWGRMRNAGQGCDASQNIWISVMCIMDNPF